MIDSLVAALPVATLPYIETGLFVLIGLMVVVASIALLRFNRLLVGGIFIAIATALWLITPEISDRVEIRTMLAKQPSEVKKEQAEAVHAAQQPLAERLHVTYVGKSYVIVEIDGHVKSLLLGEAYRGVKLLHIAGEKAVFEIDGQQVAKSQQAPSNGVR